MRIAVPRETATGERRVALVPDVVGRLARSGHEIRVERGAGERAGHPDADYAAAGARVTSIGEALDAGAMPPSSPSNRRTRSPARCSWSTAGRCALRDQLAGPGAGRRTP